MLTRGSFAIALVLSGCRAAASPVAPVATADPPGSHTRVGAPAQADDDGDPPVRGVAQPLAPEDERRRELGLRALDEGRFTDARRIFDELLAAHRENRSLQALANAARQAEADARQGAVVLLAHTPARTLDAPPWTRTLLREAPIQQPTSAPKLVQVSQARNQITDEQAWFARHDLRLPVWDVPNANRGREGNLPAEVPDRYGDLPIVHAISHPDHAVLGYGPDYSGATVLAVIEGTGQVRALFDFAGWRQAPKVVPGDEGFVDQRVTWAHASDGVLFVSTGHRTYAKSSGGANAFISALDLQSGELLWRSDPLIANAANFVLRDGWIITGYGFTAEPDFLFVLDARTGKTVSKQRVKSGPEFLITKGDELFVRTYDTDYVFTLTTR